MKTTKENINYFHFLEKIKSGNKISRELNEKT
jgi:hypothetical protein